LRELNGYCFAAFVVLHGNHGGFDGEAFSITLESYPIVELQGQSGKKNGEIGRAKLDGQFELIFETTDLVEPDPFPKGYQ